MKAKSPSKQEKKEKKKPVEEGKGDNGLVLEKKKDPLTWMTGKVNQKCPKSHAVIFVGHVKQFLSFRDIFYDPS